MCHPDQRARQQDGQGNLVQSCQQTLLNKHKTYIAKYAGSTKAKEWLHVIRCPEFGVLGKKGFAANRAREKGPKAKVIGTTRTALELWNSGQNSPWTITLFGNGRKDMEISEALCLGRLQETVSDNARQHSRREIVTSSESAIQVHLLDHPTSPVDYCYPLRRRYSWVPQESLS